MASSLVDPQERAHLRDKYKKAVRSIVYKLQSQSKPTYTYTELAQFRVSVQSIDPEDHTFTDSEACLFRPLTHEELETFKMDKEALPRDGYHYINEFKDTLLMLQAMFPRIASCGRELVKLPSILKSLSHGLRGRTGGRRGGGRGRGEDRSPRYRTFRIGIISSY
ncbi:unnamed protein product [Penicillium roqueforti FM164]|uniref:Genomic scaffold, ProqFM164S02 n=1 Tax=Penicillium roqueforti (strain FM164) TaxID=1365484 RepID=W6Q5G7_PENRF|nr:unnamed protein product [Penicillium roqueforti FM164]